MIGTLLLSYWVVTREAASGHYDVLKYQERDSFSPVPQSPTTVGGAGLWTVIFAYYCLFIHVLVAMFPLRSCWAMWDITRSLKKAAHSKALQNLKFAHRRRGSSTSLSSSETLTSSHASSTSSEAGDLEAEIYMDGDAELDRVCHAIVIPNYKEELDSLRETLEVLGCHPQARNSYDVSAQPTIRQLHMLLYDIGLEQNTRSTSEAFGHSVHTQLNLSPNMMLMRTGVGLPRNGVARKQC